MIRTIRFAVPFMLLLTVLICIQGQTPAAPFKYQQVMVPMRDGVRLQTVILTPMNAMGPLPILFRRTPYGVPANGNVSVNGALKELFQDGYIFVVPNLRGRFGSEGTFALS